MKLVILEAERNAALRMEEMRKEQSRFQAEKELLRQELQTKEKEIDLCKETESSI